MIREWYSARELAEFELDGMPRTERAFRIKADKEEWLARDKTFGKGKEYHVSNLPDAAQISLIERAVGEQRLVDLECKTTSLKIEKERGRAKFTEAERATARIAIVSLFNNFRASMGMGVLAAEAPFLKLYAAELRKEESTVIPKWIFEIYPELSSRSLHRWRAAKSKSRTVKDLGSKYGNRKGTGVLDRAQNGEVSNYIIALITKQSHLTGRHVRELCIQHFGETVKVVNSKTGEEEEKPFPSVRGFERFILKWKEENKGLYLNLTDPDSYKNKMQPAFGRADEGVERLNQVWEFDASPVDAMCNDGRYNIYSLLDVYSRRTMFLVTKTAATEGALLLIRKAILEWGVPETIKTDNGSDFVSYRFKHALVSLDIEQSVCLPYTPEGKGFVERVFRTLQHDLMPLLPGFIGHNVADRSKIEQTKAFSQRLGENDKDAFNIDMTHEELQGYIDEWSNFKYGDRIHGTIKDTPNNRASKWVGAIRKIENERVLDILLSPIASGKGYRTVTKTGIRAENATFIAPELGLHIGETVFVRHDPDDLGRIYVFDQNGEYICEAHNPESLGISRKEAAAQAKIAHKKLHEEKRKEIKAIQRQIKPRDMVDAILKRDAEQNENVITFRPETIHSSPGIIEAHKALNKYEPQEVTSLTDKQQEHHDKLVESMSEKPKVIELNSREARINRAVSLEDRLAKGNRITADDQQWLSSYQKQPEWRAHVRMKESFGNDSSWFEERGDF